MTLSGMWYSFAIFGLQALFATIIVATVTVICAELYRGYKKVVDKPSKEG